ncbi:hypothetical protein [Methanosarcina mazei]|uniref:hypothetical protein n=1 Tax=Methanosarcina mazei TaxID=2209 RepID=UPI0012D449DB|nr:hypothetical protein [Methanosarcina mazei]
MRYKKQEHQSSIFDTYMGFTIIKPITRNISCGFEEIDGIASHKLAEKLIGRTIVKTYDEQVKSSSEKRRFLTISNDINIFGVKLSIQSLPFQTQDIAVGACASTSLWITLQALKGFFDLNSLSLYEITKRSNEYVEEYRNFPSNGLTFRQVLTFLKSVGLDYDIINLDALTNNTHDQYSDSTDLKNLILTTVKAFLKYANIPIIVFYKDFGPEDEFNDYIINLKTEEANKLKTEEELSKKNDNYGLHTAVISGYKYDKNENVTELYVHDDSLGPYCRIEVEEPFTFWKLKSKSSTLVLKPMFMVIPLYSKIRLQYNIVYDSFLHQSAILPPGTNFSQKGKWNVYFTTVQKYKADIINQSQHPENVVEILTKPMPRFLWILRYCGNNGGPLFDRLYDGTAIEFSVFETVLYI